MSNLSNSFISLFKEKKEEKNIALAKKKKNHVQHKKIQEPKKSYEFKYANKQCNKKK